MPPIYEYECPSCHARQDGYRSIAERKDGPMCGCGAKTEQILSAPMVAPDLPGYESPIDGRWIEGRKARQEDLKRNQCRPYEDGEREEYIRRRQAEDAGLDRRVGETVEAWWEKADDGKREAITNAVERGVTAEIVRK